MTSIASTHHFVDQDSQATRPCSTPTLVGYTIGTALSGALGYLIAKITKVAPWPVVGLFAGVSAGQAVLNVTTEVIGEKCNWRPSSIRIVKATNTLLTSTALAVALVSLGVFSTTGLGIAVGASLGLFAFEVGLGIYERVKENQVLEESENPKTV